MDTEITKEILVLRISGQDLNTRHYGPKPRLILKVFQNIAVNELLSGLVAEKFPL
jgi:hypothetical protein